MIHKKDECQKSDCTKKSLPRKIFCKEHAEEAEFLAMLTIHHSSHSRV